MANGDTEHIEGQLETLQLQVQELQGQVSRLEQAQFEIKVGEDIEDVDHPLDEQPEGDPWPEVTVGADFSGKAYAANGTPTTGLAATGNKPWVKYVINTATFSEETGPPSDPWPANEVWWEKANTYGDIVVTRLG